MKKKLLNGMVTLTVLVVCICLLPTKAQAASESDLTFKLNNDGESYSVTDCDTSASGELTIPSTYNGKPVTGVGGLAFWECRSLTSITIPDGVTSIGSQAFYLCSNLTSIVIPNSVTGIGWDAFGFCNSLEYNIYDNAKYLGNNNNPYLYLRHATTSTNTIHNNTRIISDAAFSGCSELTSVTIPDGITTISGWTFSGCTSLTSITIPDSVTHIFETAFQNCSSLSDVYYAGTETERQNINIGSDNDFLTSANWHYKAKLYFALHSNGESYYVAECDAAVSGEIAIPANYNGKPVTSIAPYAFYGCSGLTGITIPESVTSIGTVAFYDCNSLTSVYYGGTNTQRQSMRIGDYNSALTAATWQYAKWNRADVTFYITTDHKGLLARGQEITFEVYVNGTQTVDKIGFLMDTLDTDVFEITKITSGIRVQEDWYESLSPTVATIVTSGAKLKGIAAAWEKAVTLPGNLKLCTVKLKVKDTASFSDAQIIGTGAVKLGSGNYSIEVQGLTVTIGECADHVAGVWFKVSDTTHKRVCSVCGGNEETASHEWGEGIVEIKPTCSTTGTKIYTCVCGATKTEIVPETLHDEVVKATFADQDCYYCPVCDNYFLQAGNYVLATVEFKNWDGTVILTKTYRYGDKVEIPADPTKAADNTYTYAFAGWDKEIVDCVGNATYTATYEATYINYTVKFLDENGETISKKTYHWGDEIVAPADPTKAADNTYTYAFAGWDKEVVACEGDAVYTATYTPVYNNYTVKFLDDNGETISEKTYHWGEKVEIPADPTKAADNTYTYAFAGWDKEIVDCAGDATYTATYKAAYIDYTVEFKNWDGASLSTKIYHYGDVVVIPSDPAKAADHIFRYKFAGWDKEVVVCVGDAMYTAIYDSIYVDYAVRFLDENGTTISEKTYHWGDKVIAPANPTKAADNTYTYTFAGWDMVVTSCIGPATYVATYTPAYIDYAVTFVDEDGTVLSAKTYHWSDQVEIPADPAKAADHIYTYAFAGWDKDVVNCAGNATYTATYTPVYIDYTVTFQYEDGTVISTNIYHYGDAITIPADPEALGNGYIFDSWDKTVVDCAGHAVYTAVFRLVYPVGDFTKDNEVTNEDVIYLLWHTLFPESYPVEAQADFTGDGQVTNEDVIYLLWHTLFPESYPLEDKKKLV